MKTAIYILSAFLIGVIIFNLTQIKWQQNLYTEPNSWFSFSTFSAVFALFTNMLLLRSRRLMENVKTRKLADEITDAITPPQN